MFSLSRCVTNSGTVGGGGGGAGRATFDNIVLGKHTGLATVPLVEAAATGRRIEDAVITLERAGATPFAFLVIDLQDVFAEVCWEYRSQDATGGVGETRRFCFDAAGNQVG